MVVLTYATHKKNIFILAPCVVFSFEHKKLCVQSVERGAQQVYPKLDKLSKVE